MCVEITTSTAYISARMKIPITHAISKSKIRVKIYQEKSRQRNEVLLLIFFFLTSSSNSRCSFRCTQHPSPQLRGCVSRSFPWDAGSLQSREQNCIFPVAEIQNKGVGFPVFSNHPEGACVPLGEALLPESIISYENEIRHAYGLRNERGGLELPWV